MNQNDNDYDYDDFYKTVLTWHMEGKPLPGLVGYDPLLPSDKNAELPVWPDKLDDYLHRLFGLEEPTKTDHDWYGHDWSSVFPDKLAAFCGPHGYALFRAFLDKK